MEKMEFTTTKEFILQAHKSACTEWKLKIEKEFPEVFKPELEVGKWYYNQEYDIVIYLTEHKYDDTFNGYGFNKDKEWFYCDKSVNIFAEYCNREATEKEVEEALIAEAKKRGYRKGVKLSALKYCHNEIDNKIEFYKYFPSVSSSISHRLELNGTGIYQDGTWAEIIPEEKTTISKEKALKIIAKKLKVSPKNIIIE